jgi:hypothetical protein
MNSKNKTEQNKEENPVNFQKLIDATDEFLLAFGFTKEEIESGEMKKEEDETKQ